MTGIVAVVYEDDEPSTASAHDAAAQLALASQQTEGLQNLPGTYPFTLERSAAALPLNRLLHRLIQAPARAEFVRDPIEFMADAGLPEPEVALVSTRDWSGLIRRGASVFLLEKLAAVNGTPNALLYAAMRGETLAQFQKTRNAPGALYSVAAKPQGETHDRT